MKYDPEKHHRRSIRLQGYDYTSTGAYYVTLVAQGRACLFGEIANGNVTRSLLGEIVQTEWFRSAEIRKEIRLLNNEFIVMPNHIHGIIWIVDNPVGADGVRPDMNDNETCQDRGAYHAPLRRVPRSLSSFIAGFKASVTSRARRELDISTVW